jgi:hypothetical protein
MRLEFCIAQSKLLSIDGCQWKWCGIPSVMRSDHLRFRPAATVSQVGEYFLKRTPTNLLKSSELSMPLAAERLPLREMLTLSHSKKMWGNLVRTFWPETATKSAPAQKLEDSLVDGFATCDFPYGETPYRRGPPRTDLHPKRTPRKSTIWRGFSPQGIRFNV